MWTINKGKNVIRSNIAAPSPLKNASSHEQRANLSFFLFSPNFLLIFSIVGFLIKVC
jgi:hypothetical protein